MTFDPFADAPADSAPADEAQTTTTSSPWEDNQVPSTPPTTDLSDANRVRITLKGGTDYDSPWVTIDGVNVPDALNQITGANAEPLKDLLDQAAKVGSYFSSKSTSTAASGAQSTQRGKPAAATEAPNGEERFCKHGQMTWKSGTSAKGNAYKGFFCSATSRSEQCKPEFVK